MKELTISNLSAVPLHRTHLRATDVLLCVNVETHRFALFARELVDKGLPDLLSLLVCKFGVVQLDVYARNEGIVERADSVGGEEEDAVVVLKFAKERCTVSWGLFRMFRVLY